MARKSGGLNKVLNFIGLVDDPEPRASSSNYADGYGRPSTYVPPQQRSRTEETRRRTVVRDERRGYGTDRYASAAPTRAPKRAADSARYDYDYAAPRAESRASRFESGYAQMEKPNPVERAPRVQRQKTVMCSLTTLEDCCDVIDSLIGGNVVVLTLDDLDPKLTQRAVDTLSGAVFALNATIRKASDKTYVIAPSTVEVNETYDVERRF